MLSDPADYTTDYYTSNEVVEGDSSSAYAEVIDSEKDLICIDQKTSSHMASQILQDVKEEQSHIKRKNDILDDFFALGEPAVKKKKKKKSKKSRHNHLGLTSTDNAVDAILAVRLPTIPNTEKGSPEVEELGVPIVELPRYKELPNRLGSVTPPPTFDKEALLAKRLEVKKLSEADCFDIDDEDDDLEFLKPTTYRRSHTPGANSQSSITGYQFTDQNERGRVYLLEVTSKLIPSKDSCSTFRIKGTSRFSKVIGNIITHFLKAQKDAKYSEKDIALIWIEGKMEIKPFFKPSTLRVQPDVSTEFSKNTKIPPTYLHCLLIPKANLDSFINTYPEFKANTSSLKNIADIADEIEEMGEQDQNDVSILDFSDREEHLSTSSKPAVIDLDEEQDNDDYFVIGLKGKDNKRIEVQVSHSTSIRKLLLFYLKTKGIQESDVNMKNVKLIFDDEELNLNGIVGDTELEEDFEVQIVI